MRHGIRLNGGRVLDGGQFSGAVGRAKPGFLDPRFRGADNLSFSVSPGKSGVQKVTGTFASERSYAPFLRRWRYWSATTAATMTPPLMISW